LASDKQDQPTGTGPDRDDGAADQLTRPAGSRAPRDPGSPSSGGYGLAGHYSHADPYGLAGRYGPADTYSQADPYGPGEDSGFSDLYGPADETGLFGPGPAGPADPAAGPPAAAAGPDSATAGPGSAAAGPGSHQPAPGYRRAGQDVSAAAGQPDQARDSWPGAREQAGDHQPAPAAGTSPTAGTSLTAGAQPAAYQPSLPPQQAPAGADQVPAAPLPRAAEPTERLTPDFLLPGRRRAPSPGWRRFVYQASGGLVRVPLSAAELRRREMISRVRTPVAGGHHRVAVLSLKGGVGKTTTTVGLGATMASLRGDRVIAVDANPDRGTLSDKVGLETAATVRDLLNERSRVRRYADVRAFTSQATSRLEVLASDRDPTISVAFSDDDYCNVSRVLERYYSICITDCGTGLLHSAMAGVLRLADQIVLVSSPSVDGARSASATLDWLAAHSYGDLVGNAVVVLSVIRPRSRSTVDLNRLEEHFAARCRAVTRIPYDPHLEEGAEVELDQLSRSTADAYLALAATIGDGFGFRRGPARPQA
jgi:MinD-like ATPase involved in chromosome partitioning or flagellar assembly